METFLAVDLFILIAYLCGSLSSAIIVCKLLRLPDPRGEGSGNPGTTNVLRIGGKKAALLTLLGDSLKGYVPVVVASFFIHSQAALGFVALAAFLGHVFPIFFRFQGGKGVATILGVGFALNPLLGLLMLATWVLMCGLFRYSSLAALTMAVLTPVYGYWLAKGALLALLAMSIVLLIRHKDNIQRLLDGTEGKLGKK